MDTFQTICSRKSVRSYTGQLPDREELDKLLTAANAAPVGMKAYDSLHLTVITAPTLLECIDHNCRDYMKMPQIPMLYGAPMLILISSRVPPAPNDNTAYSNAAIVAHNMALEAVDLGLGVCYLWGAAMALEAAPELAARLNLPEGFRPCCALGVGKTELEYALREIPQDRLAVQYLA